MTPLELSVADGFLSVGLIGFCAGLFWLIFAYLPRKWREAGERVERLADLSRCDWCDGFTADPRKCNCKAKGEPCTFVPLCGARAVDVDAELDAWFREGQQ